jgi:hypothetical protein
VFLYLLNFKISSFYFAAPTGSHKLYRVRPKKRRKPYLRYLWLDLNKTKTKTNHFKIAISTT